MQNKTLTILGGLALLLGSANFASACERCGCQKGVALQKGSACQKGGACQKGCGCGKDCSGAWNGYCSEGCGQKSNLRRSKGASCGCQKASCLKGGCQKGSKCSSGCDSCGESCGSGGKKGGIFGGSRFLDGNRTGGSKWGPMPQTCYNPRFGCYSGNNRHMHRYPAFHGYYYRRPYNYRNLADYPWHAELHEPTSMFSYNVPPEENTNGQQPDSDNGNPAAPEVLEDIAPPLPDESARRSSHNNQRQVSFENSSVRPTNYRR